MRACLLLPAAVACVLVTASCSKQSDTTTVTASASPDAAASAEATVLPIAAVAPSGGNRAAATTGAPGAPDASGAPSPAGSALASNEIATPPPAPAFTDTSGNLNEPGIAALGQLGVLDGTSGAFHPNDPLKRRDYVRWLFKANNALFKDVPSKLYHPGTPDETPAFKDLKPSDPDFQYIQGLSDSGVSVGFPDRTFKGDLPITREQAVSIKGIVDNGGIYPGYTGKTNIAFAQTRLPAWKDRSSVSIEYVPAMAEDAGNEGDGKVDNIGRAFGATNVFRPQKLLSRGEAATMLNVFGGHSEDPKMKRTAAAVLQPSSSATP